jgi:hypothetical protein
VKGYTSRVKGERRVKEGVLVATDSNESAQLLASPRETKLATA